MLTVKQPFTMEGTSYQAGDRITDAGLITEALTNFQTSVLQTVCNPGPQTPAAKAEETQPEPAPAAK